ncbi:hypothetical protein pb186bvf_003834 [Paramecium bursaria]
MKQNFIRQISQGAFLLQILLQESYHQILEISKDYSILQKNLQFSYIELCQGLQQNKINNPIKMRVTSINQYILISWFILQTDQ